ncbi:restriction endonuclease subunit S [Actibacterium sp. D379-3]
MRTMQLRHLATITNSNVDKLTDPDEVPVRLCNYVDVYKNDRITDDMAFMVASATQTEIKKFGLKVGDVIITKDSEDRSDIAVPAYVSETAPDLVCGYHLALLRGRPQLMSGGFLFWALQSKQAREAFSIAAGGVTRFGLTLDGMKSVVLPCPDRETQKAIADFLDFETARIDQLIEKRSQFAELVHERRLAMVSAAIVGATTDAAPWLGKLPDGWKAERAKVHFRESQQRSETGEEELLTVSHITGVTKRSEKDVNMFLAESNEGYKLVEPDDLVINTMWAWMGAMGVSSNRGLISPSYGIYRPVSEALRPNFVDLMVRSKPFIAEATRRSKGIHSSRLRLYPDAFLDMLLPIPPIEKQDELLSDLGRRFEKEDQLLLKNRRADELLREFRAALITAAVTGQIDVTTWAKQGQTDRRLGQIEEDMSVREARA